MDEKRFKKELKEWEEWAKEEMAKKVEQELQTDVEVLLDILANKGVMEG